VSESVRDGRQESAQNLATFQQTLTQQAAQATRTQNIQIDAFGLQLAGLQKSLSDTLSTQLTGLILFPFPKTPTSGIDIVYLWVDGNDAEWRAKRKKYAEKLFHLHINRAII
jgi:hypothetical protein